MFVTEIDGKKVKQEAPFIEAPPFEAAVIAAEQMGKGKTLDEACAVVSEAVKRNPAIAQSEIYGQSMFPTNEPAIKDDDDGIEDCQYRFGLAYLRLATDEMDDIAQLCVTPCQSFETWMKRKGYKA